MTRKSRRTESIALSIDPTPGKVLAVLVYVVEASLKLIGLGPSLYFRSEWNAYDFIVTVLSVAGIIGHLLHAPFAVIVVLRPLRLLHLFRVSPIGRFQMRP